MTRDITEWSDLRFISCSFLDATAIAPVASSLASLFLFSPRMNCPKLEIDILFPGVEVSTVCLLAILGGLLLNGGGAVGIDLVNGWCLVDIDNLLLGVVVSTVCLLENRRLGRLTSWGLVGAGSCGVISSLSVA